jgi:hypothetical protein
MRGTAITLKSPGTGALEFCGLEGQWKVAFAHLLRPYLNIHKNIYVRPAKTHVRSYGTDTVKKYLHGRTYGKNILIRFRPTLLLLNPASARDLPDGRSF